MNTETARATLTENVCEHYLWVGAFVLVVGMSLLWGTIYSMLGGQEALANAFLCGLLTNIVGLVMMVVMMALFLASARVRNDVEVLSSVYGLWLVGLILISLTGPVVTATGMASF